MESEKAAEVKFWERRDNQLSFAHTGRFQLFIWKIMQ